MIKYLTLLKQNKPLLIVEIRKKKKKKIINYLFQEIFPLQDFNLL